LQIIECGQNLTRDNLLAESDGSVAGDGCGKGARDGHNLVDYVYKELQRAARGKWYCARWMSC